MDEYQGVNQNPNPAAANQNPVPEKTQVWKIVLKLVFFFAVAGLLVVYWLVPFRTIEFSESSGNTNFTIGNSSEMQFHKNMRYPDSRISYTIEDCNLQKTNDMERAIEILENKTILDFYPAEAGGEVLITCDENVKLEGGLFVAGEGGPANITVAGNFNVITQGKILLIKDTGCPTPNVAIHEMLHALGFVHSDNEENIMYYLSSCDQEIGDDTIALINELYSVPSLPDLEFEEVTASVEGVYLFANISIKNNGFRDANASVLEIYAGDRLVKEIELQELGIGYGNYLSFGHLWISKLSFDELKFVIVTDFAEIDKKNNEKILKINKN